MTIANQTQTYVLGTDDAFDYTIYVDDSQATCQDISGYSLSWIVKRYLSDDDDDAILEITTAGGGITTPGVFDPDPDTNAQVATVTVEDTDTDDLSPGLYFCELKRTDAGYETVLATHPIEFVQGVHR